MNKLSITCPECKSRLSVPDVEGIKEKMISCPKCHFKAKVSVYMAGASSRGGQGADDEATQLPSFTNLTPSSLEPGAIKRLPDGPVFRLKMGHNTVGRASASSQSDIQIEGDQYMSRKHADIEVVKGAKGLEYRLIEVNSTNIIMLNDEPIDRGDIIKLVYGDVLTFGKTKLALQEAPAAEDEPTRVL